LFLIAALGACQCVAALQDPRMQHQLLLLLLLLLLLGPLD
jgi:hypothetical protein